MSEANKVGEEVGEEKPEVVAGFDGQKVKNVVIHHLKLVGAALTIWTIGWFGLHYVWVLMGLIIFAVWNMNKQEKEKRMRSLTQIAKNEQKVLARRKDLPSWVDFPDMQRAEWLNEIIFQIWPFVDKMVQKILKENVEPKMQEKLPSILKSLYFERIHLGDQAPKFGGIKVYSKNIERSEIIMDCDFIYAGDAVIKVKVKGVSAGITNLQIRGKIRFEFNPLLSQSPLVGGISVYFLEDPDVDFDLTDLLNILDIPGLSDILHCVLKEAISSFVVLPNRIKIPLSNTADLEQLKYPMPEGILRIQVIEAEDLTARDINVFSKNTSDPYAILTVGSQTLRTKTIEGTLNPVWNEPFEIFVESIFGRKIKVQLYDQDVGSNDESLGSTEISIEKIVKYGSADLWMPLEGVKSGKIHLKLDWLTFSNNASDLSQPRDDNDLATAALFVKLDSAKNLPVTNKDDDTSSPFCMITVGNHVESSKLHLKQYDIDVSSTKVHGMLSELCNQGVKKTEKELPFTSNKCELAETSRPTWEEMFSFLIKNPKHQELNIQVYDWKHDVPLGRLDFSIDRLSKNKEMRFKQPFHLVDASEDSVLTMIVELKALVQNTKKGTKIVDSDKSFGEIEASVSWDSSSNKLIVGVHKARPGHAIKAANDINRWTCSFSADLFAFNDEKLQTFVEVNLLPDKSEAGFRETKVVKDKDPRYDEEFSYFIGYDEVKARSLKATVFNLKDGKKNEKAVIGEITLELEELDLIKGVKKWYRLSAPSK